MNHIIVKCKGCEAVLSQCRCPAENKHVQWSLCAACAAKPKPTAVPRLAPIDYLDV